MADLRFWIDKNIPDQTGRIAIVTGANSGIGFHTSRFLALRGAMVLMACRSVEKGQLAANLILADKPAVAPEPVQLDLANLASIRSFASDVLTRCPRIDILINNAGVMALPKRQTVDGFEMQFGTNHLGHFALTGLLLGSVLSSLSGRVVNVSSSMHLVGRINFEDLNWKNSYQKWAAYSQSKLANLLFAYELQRRFEHSGFPAISLGCHPGFAGTNLQTAGPLMEGKTNQARLMEIGNRLFAQPAEMGALPVLYAAADLRAKGGDYIGPGSFMGYRGYPKKARSSQASYDQESAVRLWSISENLTGVHFEKLDG